MTTDTSKPAKETKAQRAERLKRALNPWEGLNEIRRFAREGFQSIPPEWIGTYFRWWGVYTQGDGAGVTGGQGGEGRALQRFMVRIRIPNGMMTSSQLRAIADLTRLYANGIADLTVRQNIQLHWVTIEALPEVMEGLWAVGLNTMGACGDVVRNVTGCPVAGVDADEIVDASPLVLEASRLLAGNSEFYNLPRKFKISISGCREWCSYPEINDIGLTAVRRVVSGHPEVGFSLRVGGGLSAEPYLGARLNAFVRWNQVVPVIKGIAELFRDSEVPLITGTTWFQRTNALSRAPRYGSADKPPATRSENPTLGMPAHDPTNHGQADVVDLGIRAPLAASRDRNLELARQVVELGVACQQPRGFENQRRGIDDFVSIDSCDRAAGDVAYHVTAGAHRIQPHRPQALHNFRQGFNRDPVQLNVLAHGEVGDSVGIKAGKVGDGAQLRGGHHAVRYADAHKWTKARPLPPWPPVTPAPSPWV